MINLTEVTFNPGGDSIIALYVNDKLLCYGDYYHDKMSDYLRGFYNALSWTQTEYKLEYISIPEEECRDILDGDDPPPLEEIREKYNWIDNA